MNTVVNEIFKPGIQGEELTMLLLFVLLFFIVGFVLSFVEGRRRKELMKELNHAQSAAVEGMRKLGTVLEHINVYYWEYDVDADIAYPGKLMREEFGYPEEIPGFSRFLVDQGVIHPQSVANHYSIYNRLRSGEKEVRVICRVREKEGELPQWRRIHHSVYIDPTSGRRMSLVTSENVSDYRRTEEIVDLALQQVGIGVISYEIAMNRLSRLQREPDDYFPRGNIIENVPAAYLVDERLHEEDRQAVIDMYEKLQKGASSAQVIARRYKPSGKMWWAKIQFINTFDKYGNPVRAIGTYEDITEQMEKRGRYESQLRFQNSAGKIAVCYIRADLNNDVLFTSRSYSVGYANLLKSGGYSNAVEVFANQIPSIEMEEEFRQTFRLENLMELYQKGEESVSLTTLMNGYDPKPIWIRTQVNLMANPVTSGLEAVLYQFDVSANVIEKMMGEKVLELNYDNLYMVDPNSDIMVNVQELREDLPRDEQDFEFKYSGYVDDLVEQYVPEEERVACHYALLAETVEREVAKRGCYTVEYNVVVDGFTNGQRAQFFLMYDYLNLYGMAVSTIKEE